MKYNELTRKYFEAAANAGELRGPNVFRGTAGNRADGTWVQFDLQVIAGTVTAAKFLAFACPHTVAVSSWSAEQSLGGPARAQLPESVQALRERFGVPVEKMGRLLVIEDAWLAAGRLALEVNED